MSELSQFSCEACRADAPRVTGDELEHLLNEVPEWHLLVENDIRRICRVYTFKNFRQALNFTNAIGELAEEEGHHPEITLEWGKVTVSWWSHKIMGLHKNDFIMAARSDEVYTQG